MIVQALTNRIDKLKQELSGLQPLPVDKQAILDKKFRLEFNYNSNHIEGNTLTYGETMLYLIFDKTTGDHEGREYEEMKGSDVALKMVQELASDKERPLTEAFIKSLNETILVTPFWKDAITQDGQQTRRLISIGDYKKHPNSVRLQNGELFHYASPQETPAKMGDLVQWYRSELERKELHPVALAALLHYKFVCIHPFDDGNGRISRLLMNYVLYYHGLPPVIVKSNDKKNYLLALNKADSGDTDSFVAYIAEQQAWSLELSIKAAKGESIDDVDDVDKEIAVWSKELDHTFSSNTILKTNAGIQELYLNTLFSFLQLFEQKMTVAFKDLFSNWGVFGKVNSIHIGSGVMFIHSIMIFPREELYVNDYYSLGLDIFMSNFKFIDRPLNVTSELEIVFHNNDYEIKISITVGGTFWIESYAFKYDAISPETKQQEIINDAVGKILKNLKAATSIND